MDTIEGDIPRLPLVTAEGNNAVTTRYSETKENGSRYRSPTPPKLAGQNHYQSPRLIKITPSSSQAALKIMDWVDRKQPSSPQSYTPVQDSCLDMVLFSKRPSSLWPSTKEKPLDNASSYRNLKVSFDGACKQVDKLATARKCKPERTESPLKGKNVPEQSEKFGQVDSLRTCRSVDWHRWPGRVGGKEPSNVQRKSVLSDKKIRTSVTTGRGMGQSSLRRVTSFDSIGKSLQSLPMILPSQ